MAITTAHVAADDLRLDRSYEPVTHLTAINARWLLDRDGELGVTLRDGRRLRVSRQDVERLLG